MVLLGLLPLPTWALGPFVRPASINPVISPREASFFHDPMNGKPVTVFDPKP